MHELITWDSRQVYVDGTHSPLAHLFSQGASVLVVVDDGAGVAEIEQ